MTLAKTAYLGLGSNVGDRRENLHTAVRLVASDQHCRVTAVSALYLTKPVGFVDQGDFLNAVIEVRTALSARDLLRLCRSIEERLGRQRTFRWGPRVIDIDILSYDAGTIDEEELVVPHPMMMERAFVLVPLAEIAPELALPGGMTAREAAERIGQEGVELFERGGWYE